MAWSDRKTRLRLQRLEEEARHRPILHGVRLTVLAMLGYAPPALLLALAGGAVVAALALLPSLLDTFSTLILVLWMFAVVTAGGLIAAILRLLANESAPDVGLRLTDANAGPLLRLLDDVRRQLDAPAPPEVLVTHDFNASVRYQRRYGLWGPGCHVLRIGLPLLDALSAGQLRVVLAHELGHLSGQHGRFGRWMYDLSRCWEQFLEQPQAGKWLRRLYVDRLIRRYVAFFCSTTLALRRQHEYAADAAAASVDGADAAARVLMLIEWLGYRIGREFWPELSRSAADNPLPPDDLVQRLGAFLATTPDPRVLQAWRAREMRTRTHVLSDHPCLRDRLAALGRDTLLQSDSPAMLAPDLVAVADPSTSALGLLQPDSAPAIALANAAWKTIVIGSWRRQHQGAAALRKRIPAEANAAEAADTADCEQQWDRVRMLAQQQKPEHAIRLLRGFLAAYPGHAAAAHTLGSRLLDADDEEGLAFLEQSMASDSDYTFPALQTMLDYHRALGRDEESDAILQRLEAHARTVELAQQERQRVSRRDVFLPHGLDAAKLAAIQRALRLFPRVTRAFLVRKQTRHITDKPSYVLAVERRRLPLEDNRRADRFLVGGLGETLPISAAIVVLRWSSASLRRRLQTPGMLIYSADEWAG